MKIVCDSCSTKYSISDDKVRGKVFKIRCKKCSHIIVVKGNTEAAPAAAEAPTDAVWHLVVEGDQVGPLTDADVRARLSRNEISPENYVWKEGFSDWLRLAEVPDFADLAPAAVAGELFSDSARADDTVGEPSAELGGFFSGAAGGDAGGSVGGQPLSLAGLSARHRSSASESAADDDAFAATTTSAPRSEGADLFGAVAPLATPVDSGRVRGGRGTNGTANSARHDARHDGGRVENLTGQRSENSVLFSLSNLQSLAAPTAATARPGTAPATEGSGLIDIRAMAASTLKAPTGGGLPSFGGNARSAEDDLPAFGAFSSAAPVLLPIPSSSGPPKWVYALVAVAAVMIIAVGAAAFSILGRPVAVEQPAPAPAVAPAPAAKAPAKAGDEKPASDKTIAAADLPPRENGDPAGADKAGDKGPADKGDKPGKGARKSKGKKGGGAAGEGKAAGGAAAAAAPAAPPSEPDKKAPSKGSLDDLLENALSARGKTRSKDDDGPSGGSSASASKKGGGDAPAAASNGPLAKAAVVSGMNGVKGKVGACYTQFKVPGMAMVDVVIGKSGKVSSAKVTGKFAGTPTGACVEGAVKTASFPPSDGLSTPYPFNLR